LPLGVLDLVFLPRAANPNVDPRIGLRARAHQREVVALQRHAVGRYWDDFLHAHLLHQRVPSPAYADSVFLEFVHARFVPVALPARDDALARAGAPVRWRRGRASTLQVFQKALATPALLERVLDAHTRELGRSEHAIVIDLVFSQVGAEHTRALALHLDE